MSTSIAELELESGELAQERQRIVAEKMALQSQIADLNLRCATTLPQHEFVKVQRERTRLVKEVNARESLLSELKAGRTVLGSVINAKRKESFGPSEIHTLVEIRDRWHGFSMDSVNHQKAREVAWKVSQEIAKLLKSHFTPSSE